MKHALYMSLCYLRRNKGKTAILVAAIALVVFLPLGLQTVVDETTRELQARARTTPLLVGRKGSPLELALSSLYFVPKRLDPLSMADVARIRGTGFALAIPLHVRFRAHEQPIVGTTLDYFAFRKLRIARGRQVAMLGECVLGANAAAALDARPGGTVMSTPADPFNLAGVYPLKMHVAGVLAPSGTRDDEAVFVDIKTAWVIAGIGHGHEDLSRPGAAPTVLKREGNRISGSAAVRTFQEITPERVASFHFHGDPQSFPLTAILAVPHDAKSLALLQGRYLAAEERSQIIEPVAVMEDLVATVVQIRNYVTATVVLLGLATLGMATLVFLLSVRIRRGEMQTMRKIGCSRGMLASLLGCEIAIVLLAGMLVAGALTAAADMWGPALLRELLL